MKRILFLSMLFIPFLTDAKWKTAKGDCTKYGRGKISRTEVLNSTAYHVKVSIKWASALCSNDYYKMAPWTCFRVKPGLCSMKQMIVVIDPDGKNIKIKKRWGHAEGTYRISKEEDGTFSVKKIGSTYDQTNNPSL